ncbi:hypothetical protein H1R20_g3938, partial [Candolleomyces eurysporus]
MCALWYTTSALSSNTGKALLNQFRYPITLTFVQFGFVAAYCLLFMSPLVRFSKFRKPTKQIFKDTLPMGLFQVGGHIFSSIAISRIPVSTVHTIKALSPLFTVAAYALLFGVSYSSKTYISLLPLTLGVMLACSFDVSASNTIGLLCAFGSALVFVSSNIFFKKIMPSNTGGLSQPSHKLDKLNLLLYSSGMAFILMVPIWMYYDLPVLLLRDSKHIVHPKEGHSSPHSVTYYFFMNGTVHYAQNIIAFVILSSTSPVTYSIASLIKRVAVICIAIVWFSQAVHPVQAFGIVLTFTGLYMYNNAKGDVAKGEKKARGPKKHLKRLAAPSSWMLDKLGGTYAPRPSPGPHKLRESLPLTVFLRNRLKYALTAREVTAIVQQRLIKIDGKVRTDPTYPAGFMDVISIEKSGEHFRLLYDVKGRFTIHRITPEEAAYKLLKVRRVAVGARGVPHVVTHDGRTIRYPDPAIKVNDTVKFELETGKITDFVKFDTGNIVVVTGGRNMGRVGVIVHREKHIGGFDIVHVKDNLDRTFATRVTNIFVIGEGVKPWVSLPKGKGLKLTIAEERDVRRKRAAAAE